MSPSLSMPLFVRPEDVILRMQLGAELQGIDDVVTSGIIGAQLHLQRLLSGKLERQSQDCMFQLDSEAFSGIQPGGVFLLELPSGFVRKDVQVTVTTTSSEEVTMFTGFESVFGWGGQGFAGPFTDDQGPFGDFTAIDPTLMKIDYDRGYLMLHRSYRDTYVRVQCDTGFEAGTTPVPVGTIPAFDPTASYTKGQQVVYNSAVWVCIKDASPGLTPPANLLNWSLAFIPMEQIPAELYEAIMSLVPAIFDASQTTNRSQEAVNQYKKATDHAVVMLQPFIRARGFSFRPIWK